jgi:septal ring factor EnvC (AmiA/AmiB activator)
MNRASKALIVLVVAALGVWGCAQGPGQPNAANAEQIKVLEGKVAKLEDAYRSVTAGRDQIRKKLADVEEQKEKLQHELTQLQNTLTKERDELKAQLVARTAERDAVVTQFEVLRKGVRSLLSQADAAMPNTGPTLTSTEPPVPGESE